MKYLIRTLEGLFLMQSWIMASQLQTYADVMASFLEKREAIKALEHARGIEEEHKLDAQFAMSAPAICAWLHQCQPSDDDPTLWYKKSLGFKNSQIRSLLPHSNSGSHLNQEKLLDDGQGNVATPPRLHRSIGTHTPLSPLPKNSYGASRLHRSVGACTPFPESNIKQDDFEASGLHQNIDVCTYCSEKRSAKSSIKSIEQLL